MAGGIRREVTVWVWRWWPAEVSDCCVKGEPAPEAVEEVLGVVREVGEGGGSWYLERRV